MRPSSKTKASSATRRVPPPAPADARRAEGGTQLPATSESAQKVRVWEENRRQRMAAKAYELWEARKGVGTLFSIHMNSEKREIVGRRDY